MLDIWIERPTWWCSGVGSKARLVFTPPVTLRTWCATCGRPAGAQRRVREGVVEYLMLPHVTEN